MDLISFPGASRVWVFQANKPLPDTVLTEVHYRVMDFSEYWTSHQKQLKATGSILHNRFVVLVVDQTQAGASGCSIDKAMHFVQSLGHHYQTDFLNRHYYTYVQNNHLFTVHADELRRLYQQSIIDDETLVYDNLVNNKDDFIKSWTKPIGESWIKRVVLKA